MLIEHLAEQLSKLQLQIDEGRAPHDQQQKLKLDFYEKRITNIESQIEKLRNGRNSN
jgi:cell division protein FtsB